MNFERAPRDSFPPGEAAHMDAAQTAPVAAPTAAGGFLRKRQPTPCGVAQHREAILDAWHAGMSGAEIAAILTASGARGCGRGYIHLLIANARDEGDTRAAAHTGLTDEQRARLSAIHKARITPEAVARMNAARSAARARARGA